MNDYCVIKQSCSHWSNICKYSSIYRLRFTWGAEVPSMDARSPTTPIVKIVHRWTWPELFLSVYESLYGHGQRIKGTGDFFLLWMLFNTASSAAPQICRRMLGLNPELFRLWQWQPDALTSRLDLILDSARSHPQTRIDLILKERYCTLCTVSSSCLPTNRTLAST